MQRKSPRRRKKVERLTYESREQSKGSVGEQSKGSVGETNMKSKNDDIETSFSLLERE